MMLPEPIPLTPPQHCKVLDRFAVFVQLVLAGVAFSSLILKRHRERPKRPFKVWLFDVSKQALGGVLLHTGNLIGAIVGGHSTAEESNPCVWYFLNILLDTTVGVALVYMFLKLYLHILQHHLQITNLHSGFYGHPPALKAFVKQLIPFMMALFSMKMTVLFVLSWAPVLFTVGEILLSPVLYFRSPKLEVLVVMLAFPLMMNIMQFWLVDSVIKEGGRLESYKRGRLTLAEGDEAQESTNLWEENEIGDEEMQIEAEDPHVGDYNNRKRNKSA